MYSANSLIALHAFTVVTFIFSGPTSPAEIASLCELPSIDMHCPVSFGLHTQFIWLATVPLKDNVILVCFLLSVLYSA